MNIENIKNPKVVNFSEADEYQGMPEIVEVSYDLWTLRITLRFEEVDHPVYVEFDDIKGFRVLDEGDLNEFWAPEVRVEGWLWSIMSGGWYDLECIRPGFVTGVTGGYEEYLMLGINDCVSVISYEKPTIRAPKP
ncbi:hypothetical protein [Marinobacter sp. R17]|uniref:hypothetical protein n=1 Tax=Marinobacter sp. R17 TaxID=2484250 RepID=UPI000F4D2615|nr:hypothetical protein [Marinobacter sp. R17]